jgi:hypothetical protein
MNFNPRKTLENYYIFTLGLILTVLLGGAFYQWKSGALNIDNISSVYESGLILEDIKTSQSPKELRKLIQSDRVREAVSLMKVLESNSLILNSSFSSDKFDSYMSSHKRSSSMLKQLISYPKQEKIVSVLVSKVESFKSFVIERNWKTLTRMSARLRAKMSPKNIRSKNFFSSRKLNRFVKNIKADISIMNRITKDSVLSELDKSDIAKRLGGLLVEIDMLKNYSVSLKRFSSQYKGFDKEFNLWSSDLAPKITLQMIKFEKTSKYIKYIFLALVGLILAAIGFGLFLNKRNSKAAVQDTEDLILKTINDGIIPLENKLRMDELSTDFIREIEKNREYFHKRISFGTVFQEALPFSSLLLDSNLNLSWANDLFYSEWNLENSLARDTVSWDYLQQYTNLGENDPVQTALRDDLAGIYQIQVKSPVTGENMPFEMYVSPVQYSGQKRIMIFFYPLRSLEDTLSNQVKSIVGPISRTLDALGKDQFSGEEKEKLAKDFEVGGIKEVFDKIVEYAKKVEEFNQGLYSEIEDLEKHYYDQVKLVNDLENSVNEKISVSETLQGNFKECKESVIGVVELRNHIEQVLVSSLNISEKIISSNEKLLGESSTTKNILEESMDSFKKIGSSRDEIKLLKSEVENGSSKLSGLIEQTLLSVRRNNLDPRLESSLTGIKQESKIIEKQMNDFNGALRNLDVALSKVEMITGTPKIKDLDTYKNQFKEFSQELSVLNQDLKESAGDGQTLDNDLVESFKMLYETYSHLRAVDLASINLVQSGKTGTEPEESTDVHLQ